MTEQWPTPDCGITRCLYLHNRHRVMPRTGAFDVVVIWYRLEAPPGACALVLAPSHAMTRYQIPSLASSSGQRYHLLLQPVLMPHQYRLQQQLVPLAWTFGPFSSSVLNLFKYPFFFFNAIAVGISRTISSQKNFKTT